MDFKEIILERRKELHLTQRELAEKLNVSDKTVSRWEVGSQMPDAYIIPSLAKVLGITIEELYGGAKTIEVNEDDQTDYELITKFKVSIITGFILAIFGIGLLFVSIIASSLLFMASIIVFIAATIYYKSKYAEKFYTKVYKHIECIYLGITIFTLLIITNVIQIFFLNGSASMLFFILMVLLNIAGSILLYLVRKVNKLNHHFYFFLLELIPLALGLIFSYYYGTNGSITVNVAVKLVIIISHTLNFTDLMLADKRTFSSLVD